MIDDNRDHARAEPVPGTPHILVVEQQPAVREMLWWILRLAGYRVTANADRNAALTWQEWAMPADDPVVMLLDLSLPRTTEAANFLFHLRARWQEAGKGAPRVIVLTTSPQVRAELEAREHVLLKPFYIRDLLALIQELVPISAHAINSGSLHLLC